MKMVGHAQGEETCGSCIFGATREHECGGRLHFEFAYETIENQGASEYDITHVYAWCDSCGAEGLDEELG